jgi:1-acyl-sn-glycerol-3-phosphate acyltransferase
MIAHAQTETVAHRSRFGKDRLMQHLIAMVLAWPALVCACVLMEDVRSSAPGWVLHGGWAAPAALAASLLVSCAAFRTCLPGLVGWGAGLLLLLLAGRLVEVPIAVGGLPALLVIQGPVTITLVLYARARSRRCARGPLPMTMAYAVMLNWALGMVVLALLGDWRWAALGALLLLAWLALDLGARLALPPTGRLPADVPTVLNSIFGYGSFVFCCLTLPLMLPLVILVAALRPRLRLPLLAALMRRGMTGVLFAAPTVGWRYDGEIAGLEGARVVVANHEGMLDILAVCSLPGTRTLLAKTWVFRAFPLGLAARAAGLRNSDELEAGDYREDAGRTARADDGAGILVFPEGRRSRSGEVERFRPGAFVLASSLDVPVIPVAIAGSRQGIRPDGMWIHPTIVHCRVLPAMRLLAGESHRQFAERTRTAIQAARCALMREHLCDRRMIANRLHHFTGLGGGTGRAIRAESQAGAWRLLQGLRCERADPWLLLGCGWSTMAVSLRQLQPASALVAIDPDARHREVAASSWLQPDIDVLLERYRPGLLPERLAGVVCLLSWPEVQAQAVLEDLLGRRPATLLVRQQDAGAWCAAVAGAQARETSGGVTLLALPDTP